MKSSLDYHKARYKKMMNLLKPKSEKPFKTWQVGCGFFVIALVIVLVVWGIFGNRH